MSSRKTSFLRAGVVSAKICNRRAGAIKPMTPPSKPTAAETMPAAPAVRARIIAGVKRIVKDIFRPLVLPAMRRVTWSVDRSDTSSRTVYLSTRIEALSSHLEQEARRSAAARTVLENLSTDVRKELGQQSAFRTEIVASLAEGTSRLATLEAEITDLTRMVSSLAEDTNRLAVVERGVAELAGAASSLAEDTSRLATLEAEIADLTRMVSSLAEDTNRLAVVERGVADLALTVTEMQQGYEDRAQSTALRREPAVAVDLSASAQQMAEDLRLVVKRSLGLIVPVGNGLVLARTDIGFLALDTADITTVAYLAEGHLPEQGSLDLLDRLLKPGDGFIDAGANYGIFSITGGRKVGPEGRVLAIEPNPAVVRALRTTLHLNGLAGRVRVEEVAASWQNTTAAFFVAEISGHSSLYRLAEAAEPIEVRVRRLDDLTEPGSRWSVAKLDTEGAELDILQGMERLRVENPDLHVIVEFGPSHIRRTGSSVEAWIATWQEAGFTAYEIDPYHALVTPIRQTGLEEVESINLLMAPHGAEAVQEFLRPVR